MPKPNYAFAKRQREMAKKQKKEAKQRERAAEKTPPKPLPPTLPRHPNPRTEERENGYRHRQDVQRFEGLRPHHPGSRRTRALRALRGDQGAKKLIARARVEYDLVEGTQGATATNIRVMKG
jgi:hypothetical protein